MLGVDASLEKVAGPLGAVYEILVRPEKLEKCCEGLSCV